MPLGTGGDELEGSEDDGTEHDEESEATEGAAPRVFDSKAGADELDEKDDEELDLSIEPLEPLERLELALPDLSDLSLPVVLSELP